MATIIHSNGSKWYGEAPDPIEKLLARLASYTLDPTFEEYGDFAMHGDPAIPRGHMRFFGNFHSVSAVFSVDTDDQDLIDSLVAAIKANKATQAYIDARHERAEYRVRCEARKAAQLASARARRPN